MFITKLHRVTFANEDYDSAISIPAEHYRILSFLAQAMGDLQTIPLTRYTLDPINDMIVPVGTVVNIQQLLLNVADRVMMDTRLVLRLRFDQADTPLSAITVYASIQEFGGQPLFETELATLHFRLDPSEYLTLEERETLLAFFDKFQARKPPIRWGRETHQINLTNCPIGVMYCDYFAEEDHSIRVREWWLDYWGHELEKSHPITPKEIGRYTFTI